MQFQCKQDKTNYNLKYTEDYQTIKHKCKIIYCILIDCETRKQNIT